MASVAMRVDMLCHDSRSATTIAMMVIIFTTRTVISEGVVSIKVTAVFRKSTPSCCWVFGIDFSCLSASRSKLFLIASVQQ